MQIEKSKCEFYKGRQIILVILQGHFRMKVFILCQILALKIPQKIAKIINSSIILRNCHTDKSCEIKLRIKQRSKNYFSFCKIFNIESFKILSFLDHNQMRNLRFKLLLNNLQSFNETKTIKIKRQNEPSKYTISCEKGRK